MDNKKKIEEFTELDVQEAQEIEEEGRRWRGTGLEGSGRYWHAIDLIKRKYDLKRQHNNQSKVNTVLDLTSNIPNNNNYKIDKNILKKFEVKERVSNYSLAKLFGDTKLSKSEYISGKDYYHKRIKNCFRSINVFLTTHSLKYRLSFNKTVDDKSFRKNI